jgi:hypothetical protein
VIDVGLRERAIRSFAELAAVFKEHEQGTRGLLAVADNGGHLVLGNTEAQCLFNGSGSIPDMPDPLRRFEPRVPGLTELVLQAVERSHRNRHWVGLARLHLPALRADLALAFRPAIAGEHVVGVIISASGAEEGEPLETKAPAPTPLRGRVIGLLGNRLIVLGADEVRFAECDGNSVWLDTDRGRLRASGRGLGSLEDRLRGQGFLRVHRCFLVNLGRVKEIAPSFKGRFWLVLDGLGRQLVPVSRRRTAEVRRALGLS